MVERHIRPRYEQTTAMFAQLVEAGHVPDIPVAHLYYILTGAGPTMFVLAPECRRLSGVDPQVARGRRGPRRRRDRPCSSAPTGRNLMHHPLQLAYLGLEVPDPSSLTSFFGDVIGLVPGDAEPRRDR